MIGRTRYVVMEIQGTLETDDLTIALAHCAESLNEGNTPLLMDRKRDRYLDAHSGNPIRQAQRRRIRI
jgi:hypothetical protein